jgi:small GTP-binding protein
MSSAKKIVLVGHFGVGKSSLIRRFVQNSFSDDYLVTIGVHVLKKVVQLENQETTLVIWDIEGKDDVQKVRSSYLLGTHGFIYVVDPTRSQTYERVQEDLEFLNQNYSKSHVITVANKIDLIDLGVFKKTLLEKEIMIDYFASAKNGLDVETIFENLTRKMAL